MLPFGKWAPDAYGLNSGFAGEALGVLPGINAYHPFPQMAVSSVAMGAACRGAYAGRTSANAVAIFTGRATKLNKFAGIATSWTDVTRSSGGDYALATDDLWQFAQFGAYVYATQITDALQSIEVNSGTNFAAVSGSPPKARYIAVVGDFLMLGNTDTSSREVRWCGRNDPATWTKGTKDADAQTFPDGGDVMGLTGFEQGGLIFQTETVRQMTIRNDAAVMEFHRIEAAQGTLAPYSVVTRRGVSSYYSVAGFQRIAVDGSSEAIGANWIDDWFRETSNAATRPKAIVGANDPASQRIFWLFAASGNATSSIFDHVLCFDPTLTGSDYGPWSHAAVSASLLFPAATTATTLEGLGSAGLGYTLETVPYSLDADIWKGGAPRLGAFDSAFKMNFFSGAPMAATLQVSPFEPIPKRRAFVQGFRLYSDTPTASGRVAGAERAGSTVTWAAPESLNDQGRIPARISTRILAMEVTIPAGTDWTHAAGVDFDEDDVTPDGER